MRLTGHLGGQCGGGTSRVESEAGTLRRPKLVVGQSSSIVISLDLEQAWGCEPHRIGAAERAAFLGVRDAVPRILDLAERYGVAITWATVGLLFFDDRDEMLAHLPAERPDYADPGLCAYSRLAAVGPDEKADPLHFGRSLLRQIQSCPLQEIGGHSFSHYYTFEDAGNAVAFEDDLAAAARAAALMEIELKSFVFPRNQVNPAYLPICRQAGYISFRGVQRGAAHASRSRGAERAWHRASRWARTYLPDYGAHPPSRPSIDGGLANLAASHFLRPTRAGRAIADRLQRARIRKGMVRAAQAGAMYHLWWHPQNFGLDVAANIEVLRGILEDYRHLADRFGMASVSMGELGKSTLTTTPALAELA